MTSATGRRRATHSLESVLTEAVALLDEAGESALTFRALAARLGGGVGSIYWYVGGKEELLDRAADHVMAGVTAAARKVTEDDPIRALRALGCLLYEAMATRPWLGRYFIRNTENQPDSLLFYEQVGQQVLRLGLTARESFHATSAVIGYVVGVGAEMSQAPPEVASGEVAPENVTRQVADQWLALDPEQFPFLHAVHDEFANHRDIDQFRAGLDLLLAGLRLQAENR